MNIPFCAFNGVEDPDETLSGCDHIWSQWEREMVAMALNDAEEALATQLRYYLGPRFITDAAVPWTQPLQLNWGYVEGGGVQGLTEVTPSASDFTVDPATITVAQSDFSGGVSEIYIIETSSGLEIIPDQVTESGTDYIIEIDQCKLIEWDDIRYQTTAVPIDYDALFPAATWLKLADLTVYREYLDTSEQATLTFGTSCRCWCSGEACAGTERDGCVYVLDEVISKVRVSLATYNATTETWACSYETICGCHTDDKVAVSYRAGTTDIPGWEQAVMRLAHTYMAVEPCGCAMFDFVVSRDRNVPAILTAERINNPLGTADGAWFAWQWMKQNQHLTAVMLGNTHRHGIWCR